MTDVNTFWCEPTGRAQVSLRRYLWRESTERCKDAPLGSAINLCTGRTVIGVTDIRWRRYDPTTEGFVDTTDGNPDRVDATGAVGRSRVRDDDPRWPTACDRCGLFLADTAARNVDSHRIYADPAGREHLTPKLPAGALYDSWWRPRADHDMSLTVVLPDGVHWQVDGPATGSSAWQRTGDPRTGPVTVTPSIQTPGYHGFLTDGILKEV